MQRAAGGRSFRSAATTFPKRHGPHGRLSHRLSFLRSASLHTLVSPCGGPRPAPRPATTTTTRARRYTKQTINSVNAIGDGDFVQTMFGLTYETETESAVDDSDCATRAQATGLADWLSHFFTSHVTNEGSISTKSWVEYWNGLHGELGSTEWEGWDQFMSASTTYFSPDITSFLTTLQDNGVAHLKRSYLNPLDGSTMYALVVTLPFAGRAFEVHGATVDESARDSFAALGADECEAAFAVGQSVDELQQAWTFFGGVVTDGVPSLLIVKVSEPTAALGAASEFMRSYVPEATRYLTRVDAETEGGCGYEALRLTHNASVLLKVEARFIHNPAARVGSRSVADFEAYTRELHASAVGTDRGWDRWLDTHVAIDVSSSEYLDATSARLAAGGIPFHAHTITSPTDDEGNAGSVWSAGPAAMAIEFKGTYNYSYFNKDDLVDLDFCTKSSS